MITCKIVLGRRSATLAPLRDWIPGDTDLISSAVAAPLENNEATIDTYSATASPAQRSLTRGDMVYVAKIQQAADARRAG